jgi:hypothetical protein
MKKSPSKPNYQDFVNAVRAKGRLPQYGLGDIVKGIGQVALAPVTGGASLLGVGGLPSPGEVAHGVVSGLTPQSDFQSQLAPTVQQNYSPIIDQAGQQALAGFGQAQGNIANQQALAQQFLAQGQGQGPNPAQAQLAQNTGANVANQAALQAGQRGAASNVGLMARQAGQQGAATQQAATGQAATLQAQQQIAAQQAAAQQQAQIGQQIAQQQQVANQLFGTGAGALNTQNANQIANYGQVNQTNAATAAANAAAQQKTSGGLLGGIGSALSMGLFADGGQVPKPAPTPVPQTIPGTPEDKKRIQDSFNQATGFADGGMLGVDTSLPTQVGQSALQMQMPQQSFASRFLSGMSNPEESFNKGVGDLGGALGGKLKGLMASDGGKIPSHPVVGEQLAAKGMKVPGKAKVSGDSLKNDTVPAMLSPGEIVLPKSVVDAPDAPKRAMAFVQAIQAKQRSGKRGKRG